jgi:hypothetical protein
VTGGLRGGVGAAAPFTLGLVVAPAAGFEAEEGAGLGLVVGLGAGAGSSPNTSSTPCVTAAKDQIQENTRTATEDHTYLLDAVL